MEVTSMRASIERKMDYGHKTYEESGDFHMRDIF